MVPKIGLGFIKVKVTPKKTVTNTTMICVALNATAVKPLAAPCKVLLNADRNDPVSFAGLVEVGRVVSAAE
jgi:hypothetical protein